MPPDNKDQILRIRITAALKQAIEDIAAESGESTSVIVRQALRGFIDARTGREAPLPGRAIYPATPLDAPRLNDDTGTDDETD